MITTFKLIEIQLQNYFFFLTYCIERESRPAEQSIETAVIRSLLPGPLLRSETKMEHHLPVNEK